MSGQSMSASMVGQATVPNRPPVEVDDRVSRTMVRTVPSGAPAAVAHGGSFTVSVSPMTNVVELRTGYMPDLQPAPLFVPVAPRFNFAGYCIYCGERGCTSNVCIGRYAGSWWAVCDQCDGRGGDGISTICESCLYGVNEVYPGHPGAVQPVVLT
jgi:hypothetical protein